MSSTPLPASSGSPLPVSCYVALNHDFFQLYLVSLSCLCMINFNHGVIVFNFSNFKFMLMVAIIGFSVLVIQCFFLVLILVMKLSSCRYFLLYVGFGLNSCVKDFLLWVNCWLGLLVHVLGFLVSSGARMP